MKLSVKFGLHAAGGRANASGELPIRLRVSWSGLRADVRSGYVISPAKWDAAKGCVVPGAKNSYRQAAGEINRALVALAAAAEGVLEGYWGAHGEAPTAGEFKRLFDVAVGRAADDGGAKTPGFFEVFDLFTAEVGASNCWTRATRQKFATVRRHLLGFDPSLSLETFSKADFAAWVEYLHNEAGLSNVTASKDVGFVRWFLRWAAENGHYGGSAHLQFKPRFRGLGCHEVVYLGWEELQGFLGFDFGGSSRLAAARDVFCFCCFTGLRYSDAYKLRRSDLRLDASPPYMAVVTKKTSDRLHIELNRYALAILAKYSAVPFPDDKALPVISNQRMNDYLHEAAELAGIDEPIRLVRYRGNERTEEVLPKHALLSSHCGRRTFIVNALRLGIPAPVIMEWTGHSDYKAMKPYIKIVDAAKAENMEKFNRFGDGGDPPER